MHNKKYCRVKLRAGWIYSLHCSMINSPNTWIIQLEVVRDVFLHHRIKGKLDLCSNTSDTCKCSKWLKVDFMQTQCALQQADCSIYLNFPAQIRLVIPDCSFWKPTVFKQTHRKSVWAHLADVDEALCGELIRYVSLLSPCFISERSMWWRALHGYGEYLILSDASQ